MTDQTKTLELELSGLKGDHPLGFLAACGVLRVMGTNSGIHLGWAETHGTWTAVLHGRVATDTTGAFRERIVDAVAQAAEAFPAALDSFGLSEAECQVTEFRGFAHRALDRRCFDAPYHATMEVLLPGLGTDCLDLKKQKKQVIQSSKLIMTSGNQNFVTGLKDVVKTVIASQKKRKGASNATLIQEALLGPWSYTDKEHSLGWDPTTQRLHALRNKAPAGDKQKRSVAAAVLLASQALPLFPCFAVGGWLRTTGFHHDDEGDWFSWPIWRAPLSLDALRTLVAQPFTRDLKERGVAVVYRCHRSRTGGDQGNYRVFGHPTKRPWPEM